MKVLVCDDHLLLAEALAGVLRNRGHEPLPSVTRPEQALTAVQSDVVDVCVMDIGFPDSDGLDAVRAVRRTAPHTNVVVLSGRSEPQLVDEALAAGASAYVVKGEDTASVVSVIERVAAGERGIAPVPFEGIPARDGVSSAPGAQLARFLTPREREVLERLARGESTAAMAKEMGVAYSTARTHIQNTLTKLGVHSKLAAVTLAFQHGLVTDTRHGRTG